MTLKKRPKCTSLFTKKDGKQTERQRYQCKSCGHKFQYKKRTKLTSKKLWDEYTRGKQTLTELAENTKRVTSPLESI